ncbi:MAG TPA: hypothetical protein VFV99_33235 [Kofleriaceae bacterium]|nr:hypothetical protein [Kofleriaceae bacterium]
MVYVLLAAALLAPVAAVAVAQLLAEGRFGNKITAHGWAGLGGCFVAGQLTRQLLGVTIWSGVAGVGAAIAVGLVARAMAKRSKREDETSRPQ